MLVIIKMVAGEFLTGGLIAGFIALFFAFLIFMLLFVIACYIYSSLAFVAIAKKARYYNPSIAWIPVVGPALIASKTAKMPWWPILLLIGTIIPIIGGLFCLAFAIFSIIWMWKTFEVIGKPGWWAILLLIPIVNLIMLGIAAWSKK